MILYYIVCCCALHSASIFELRHERLRKA
jgi:hypothetical protein